MEDRERRQSAAGAEEAKEEGSSTEDVELHRKKSVQQNDEPTEGQSDDDVELHRRKSVQ